MSQSAREILGEFEGFTIRLLDQLEKISLYKTVPLSELFIDHICYRVSSYKNYTEMKVNLSRLGYALTETEVNGRPIVCYKLFKPLVIKYQNLSFQIPVIELPAPKPGKVVADGLEHIEIALGYHPLEIKKQFQNIRWNDSGLSKKINPELEIEFLDLKAAVKFHEKSIEEIISKEIHSELTHFVYEDDHLLAIDKPAGFFIQPPQLNRKNSKLFVNPEKSILPHLNHFFSDKVYPVHRLDSATTGLVLIAKNREIAGELNLMFRQRKIEKKYWALVRGFTEPLGLINKALKNPLTDHWDESETYYKSIEHFEINSPLGKYPTARYSWLEVRPITGRWRQIRRHLDQIAHPIVGDIDHGDGLHNRYFRDILGLGGLFLRAQELKFTHPITHQEILIQAPQHPRWNKLKKIIELSKLSAS